MLSMAKALLSRLDADSVLLNTRVTAISKTDSGDFWGNRNAKQSSAGITRR